MEVTPSQEDHNADDKPLEKSMEDRVHQLGLETDSSFVLELLDSYAPLFQKHFGNIQDAIANRDATKLHFAAHTLKGASLNIGANQLASVCRKIEDSSEDKDFDTAGKLLDDLQKELRIAISALESIKTRLSRQKP